MINKNKETIEKLQILINQGKDFCKRNNFNKKTYEYLDLVIGRKVELKATIKTSIEWCEDEVKELKWFYKKGNRAERKLIELESHLKWLKE